MQGWLQNSASRRADPDQCAFAACLRALRFQKGRLAPYRLWVRFRPKTSLCELSMSVCGVSAAPVRHHRGVIVLTAG